MGEAQRLNLPPPFEEAVQRHERELMRFLLRATLDRDDALDLFQETWLRAYRAYPRLTSADGLRPWLFRIATNLCRNRTRDRMRRARVISDKTLPEIAEYRSSLHDGELAIRLRQAVKRLQPIEYQAFLMRKLNGFGYGEIGRELGCSAANARARVHRALRKLGSLR
jgi:RNA polymerase sigma-70 factor, ECF subfamily